MNFKTYQLALFMAFFSLIFTTNAQRRSKTVVSEPIPEALYSSLEYRLVGPFRGGRSAAVTGVPGQPNLFYFGATGGGVWKTNGRRQNLGKYL